MRANVFLKWNPVNRDVGPRNISITNVFGRSFDQVAERATDTARDLLVAHESEWNGVDPLVSTIEVTSHGAE